MNNHFLTIKEMPEELRPYEKCIIYGTSALTNEELLAIIIKTGTRGENSSILASRVLTYKDNSSKLTNLMHMTVDELMKIKGIGKVKAIQIKCLCELSVRISMEYASKELDFKTPESIADYYMERLRHLDIEQLIVVFLDSKCMKIKDKIMTLGTVNQSMFSPREIFIEALKCDAVNIVILHNHPSGDSSPSRNDLVSTKRIKEAGELIGIHIIDHIIIGDKVYTSLKQIGVL